MIASFETEQVSSMACGAALFSIDSRLAYKFVGFVSADGHC